MFQDDNAWPHSEMKVSQRPIEFDWDVLFHPPYSPDLTSNFYLYGSLENSMNDQVFISLEYVKEHLDHFFTAKCNYFFKKGIFQMPER